MSLNGDFCLCTNLPFPFSGSHNILIIFPSPERSMTTRSDGYSESYHNVQQKTEQG